MSSSESYEIKYNLFPRVQPVYKSVVNALVIFFAPSRRSKAETFVKTDCGDVLFVSDNVGDYSDADVDLLKKIFKKSDAVITSAGFVSEDELQVCYTENGESKTLRFNMKTGESNVSKLI